MENTSSTRAFSLRRLGLFLRRDLAYGYRSTLIAMASVAGVVILTSAASILIGGAGQAVQGFDPYTTILVVGGLVYTSSVFRELHKGAVATPFLLLPGSPLEKFVSKALITSVGYALAGLVFCTAASALSEGLNWLIFRAHHELFNPVRANVLRTVAGYLVAQAIFLTGSVYFRKMAFIKTVGVVSGLLLLSGALGALIACRALGGHIALDASATASPFSPELGAVISGLSQGTIACPLSLVTLTRVAQVLYWALLAPACWVVGYLKMREIEV
jgi:hypothetical protein